jgi:hypothetical protein
MVFQLEAGRQLLPLELRSRIFVGLIEGGGAVARESEDKPIVGSAPVPYI